MGAYSGSMSGVCTKVNLKEASLTGVTSEETPVGGYVIRYNYVRTKQATAKFNLGH